MEIEDVVNKLIGDIRPVGESKKDEQAFENLKRMCLLVDNLVKQIDDVHWDNIDAHQASIIKSAEYADHFLTVTLGIKND